MAKKKKNTDPVFERLKQEMPEDLKKILEEEDINSMEDMFLYFVAMGYDPVKITTPPEDGKGNEDFNPADYAIDKGSEMDEIRNMLLEEDDEEFEDVYKMPDVLLIEGECKEYHIRVKLNNAPVKIWRELLVPSNVSLELLALLLIEAMGWNNSHLHQFRKGDVLFKSTEDLQASRDFIGFGMPRMIHDANQISLGNVLKEKGDRMKFEYDFGDSWEHEVWVKGIREYEEDEEPEAVLVKGAGACPPDDCGGVWGYEELLNIRQKKRKKKEEKEMLEWFGIDHYFDPCFFGHELAEEAIEDIWRFVKDEPWKYNQ